MRLMITGAAGMLGLELLECAQNAGGVEAIPADRKDFDVLDRGAFDSFVHKAKPDALIHCAARTDVDGCEGDPAGAFAANAEGSRNAALACAAHGVRILYVSTDYVFDGTKNGPYYEYDAPAPINVYGMSKYYGERYVSQICNFSYIVRTSWLFGRHGKNFVGAVLSRARSGEKLRVVADQWGSPTYTADLATFLIELIKTEKFGIYHATNDGFCTWYDFARNAIEISGVEHAGIEAISTGDLARKAARPQNSMLHKISLKSAGFDVLPHWRDALERYLGYR